ncbi:MAG: ATP-binding protein [Bacilli bacterium]
MRNKIFGGTIIVSSVTLFLTTLLLSFVFYQNTIKDLDHRLQEEGMYIAKAFMQTDISYLNNIGLTSDNRITLIDVDGVVLYDNFAVPQTMDNHLNRPEVKEAIASGEGSDVRQSDTIGLNAHYYAIKMENGQILRMAATTKTALAMFGNTLLWIIPIIILGSLIAIFLTSKITGQIVKPILKLNLDYPLNNYTYPELSPLLIRMARQNKKIDEQIKEANAKQEEFLTITENLEEGFIVFDEQKNVLLANKSAKAIFKHDMWEGTNYLKLSRDLEFIRIIDSVYQEERVSSKVSWNGKIYRLLAHSVKASNEELAAVLFITDITERELLEIRRKEFSANVSHELKTPLTSIMGYAEIMEKGIAKTEDIPRFSKQIHQSASHLLALIDDIIKISRLDEGDLKKQFGEVDLSKIINQAITTLQGKADSNHVNLDVQIKSVLYQGIEKVLYELVYNLIDNAIIYNHEGGHVFVKLTNQNNQITLVVKDDGIGIAKEYQSRIFERFYRIDPSHSKSTGGTGLGLSIVKHAAIVHNAKIELESEPGLGTTITVIFPN